MPITPPDLIGKRFGQLVVVHQAGQTLKGEAKWLCRCDCGKTKIVKHQSLIQSTAHPCRCNRREVVNLIGRRFGRLVVVNTAERNRHNQPQWLCQCDCGKSLIVRGCNLTSNNTRSCGCLLLESIVKHGMSQTPTYQSWASMLNRCNQPTDPDWYLYGGRGIKVEPRWSKFENFWADMGTRPLGTSLDRIDPDGDYCKENCCFAVAQRQANNRRSNHFLTFQGEKKTISEWSRELGISHSTLCYRLQAGWSIEQAFTQPVDTQCYSLAKKRSLMQT